MLCLLHHMPFWFLPHSQDRKLQAYIVLVTGKLKEGQISAFVDIFRPLVSPSGCSSMQRNAA